MIKGNDVALFLSGSAVPIPSCNIVITQPTIKQIVAFGEEQFLTAAQMFGNAENFAKPIREGNPELGHLSDFQIVMILALRDPSMNKIVNNFFELIFPIYEVEMTEADISFILKEQNYKVGMITPFNYEEFFTTIRDLFIMSFGRKDEINYDPVNSRAAEIAEKMKKGRERVQQIKGKGQDPNMSIFATYTSVLSIGMQMDINIFFNYTPFQLYDAFSRYWKKSSSDFYQKLASTPLMDVSKMDAPDEWSDNLY